MKTKKMGIRHKLYAGLCLMSFAGMASAVTVTLTPSATTVAEGDTFTVAVAVTPDGATTNFSFRLNYDTALADATQSQGILDLPSSCPVVASNANINDELGRVSINTLSATGNPITFSGTYCTVTFVAAAAGTLNLTPSNTFVADDPGGSTFGSASVTIEAPAPNVGPLITEGAPAFGSSTNVSGGTLGGAAVTQDISFGASTGGSGTGTTDLVCTDDDAATTLSNSTQNDIANGDTPATMVASFTPGAARTVSVSCTATRDGAADQTFSYTFEVAAGTAATGPTLSPPASTTVTVSGGAVGGFGTGSIQFSATGGTGGSTALNCTATAPVEIVSGGTQTVATGSQPAPVNVRIQLTTAPQSGTVTCNGTVFTINAPGGTTFTPPEVIPSASTWSKIAMFSLLGLFGMMAVGFRRQG